MQPRCAHFGVCGGCALQHLEPAAQLALKEQQLRENLERVARVSPERWLPPLTGPVWGYRRRARLGAKFVRKKGRALVGFRERAAPYVAELERCEVLAATAGEIISPLARLLDTLAIREQLPQIEVAVADNATALVLRVLASPAAEDLARLRAFAHAHGVRIYLQTGGLESVVPLEPYATALEYRLAPFDLTLAFAPTDFHPGEAAATPRSRAVELLAEPARVLDLFAGHLFRRARHAQAVVAEGRPRPRPRARQRAANATRLFTWRICAPVGEFPDAPATRTCL